MTDPVTPHGEPQGQQPEGEQATAPSSEAPPAPESTTAGAGEPAAGETFGEEAAQMANETEVEAEAQAPSELDQANQALAERTNDLQRLQAEFLNYKRRVERDREQLLENAAYKALSPIVEVLDTIDRAREHGPLEDGLKAVAEQLERTVATQGLIRFGTEGDAFDPMLHEALSHVGEDADVQVTTCKVIVKSGYRIGDRVVRAAQVLVVDPPA